MLVLARDCAVFFAIYLLFAGQLSTAEACAGAALATATAGLVLARRGQQHVRLGLRAVPWPLLAWRVFRALAIDALRVSVALTRAACGGGSRGVVVEQPVALGGDDPASITHRSVVVLAASIAPNGYVAEMADGNRLMRLHRLVGAPAERDTAWPV